MKENSKEDFGVSPARRGAAAGRDPFEGRPDLFSCGHLCLLHETPAQRRAALASFLSNGIRQKEKCLCVVADGSAGELRALLEGAGVAAAEEEAAGRLLFFPVETWRAQSGVDPEELFRFLAGGLTAASREGCPAVRVVIEFDPATLPGSANEARDLLRFEALLNQNISLGLRSVFLCVYDLARLAPDIARELIYAHPYIVHDGRLHRNFYYLPPEELLAPGQAAAEVARMLAALETARAFQENLRASELMYRSVFESTGAATVIVDADTTLSLVNTEFARISGYSREELEGKRSWTEFVFPEDLQRMKDSRSWTKVAKNAAPRMNEFRFVDRQGRVRRMHVTAAPVPGTKKSVASLLDVTEQKEAEEALRGANEELETALEELTAAEEELRAQLEEIREKEEEIREWERRFRTVLENVALAAVMLNKEGRIIFVNNFLLALTGWRKEEVTGRDFFDLFIPEEKRAEVKKSFFDALARGFVAPVFTVEVVTRTKKRRLISWSNFLLFDAGGHVQGAAHIGEDITERRPAEELFKILSDSSPVCTYIIQDGVFQFVNPQVRRLTGYTQKEALGLPWYHVVDPRDRERVKKNAIRMLKGRRTAPYEYRFVTKKGEIRWVMETVAPISYRGRRAILGCSMDVTERKEMEEKLRYLSLHDPLTGLYNRTYFEEEMRRLDKGRHTRTGVVVADVDGLKLVNDTFGHDAGDGVLKAAAKVIRKCFREEDVVARIGGDEFAVLLPGATAAAAEEACRRIKKAVAAYNEKNPAALPLSISAGFAAGGGAEGSLPDIFREADNNMYREKLFRQQSARSAVVKILEKALEARDFLTEGHGERLLGLVVGLAEKVGVPAWKMTDLKLLARFHDIGKVGVPDRVLFKPGPLTAEERKEMQRHCEIGYRIAVSSPDLAGIADFILKHHEWWNGEGYPLRLKGEEIPLECRILAVADAYDAMTTDRPYRKGLSKEKALEELVRCAGTQFDPYLVEIFVRMQKESEKG